MMRVTDTPGSRQEATGVAEDPAGSFYDTPAWHGCLTRCFGNIRSHRLAVWDGTTRAGALSLFEIRSLLTGRKLVSNPFHLPCQVRCPADPALVALLAHVVGLAKHRRMDYIQIVAGTDAQQRVFEGFGFRPQHYYDLALLDLAPGYEAVFRAYKRQFRTNLRRVGRAIAADGRFAFAQATDLPALKCFHGLLTRECRRKHLNLPWPLEALVDLWHGAQPGRGITLFGLWHGRRMVAATVIGFHRHKAYYAWSASDPAYEPWAVSTYLLDRVIGCLIASRPEIKRFDLGLVGPCDHGLRFFKSRWGAVFTQPVEYTLALKPGSVQRLDAGRQALGLRRLVRLVPDPVLARLAAWAYHQLA